MTPEMSSIVAKDYERLRADNATLRSLLERAEAALTAARKAMTNGWYNAPRRGMEAEHAQVSALLSDIREHLARGGKG